MMMHILAGATVWTVASVGLALILGRVMRGYAVNEPPAGPPVADAPASYRQAA